MSQCHTNSKCILILLKAANEGKLEKMNNISKLADLLTLTNFLFPIYLGIQNLELMIYTVNYYSLGTGSYGGSEKRRKPMQLSSLTYLLDDSDVIDDLKIINKNKAFSVSILFDKMNRILENFLHNFLFTCR